VLHVTVTANGPKLPAEQPSKGGAAPGHASQLRAGMLPFHESVAASQFNDIVPLMVGHPVVPTY